MNVLWSDVHSISSHLHVCKKFEGFLYKIRRKKFKNHDNLLIAFYK